MTQSQQGGFRKIITIPATLGIAIGVLAALIQAMLASAGGPEAYGFCVACHTRDIADSLANLFGLSLPVPPFSNPITVLTPIGVLLGAFISAKVNKEFRVKKSNWKTYVKYFFGGIIVIWFALMLGACPYRAALRAGYGDMVAVIGVLSIFLGVFVGTRIVLRRMEKEVV